MTQSIQRGGKWWNQRPDGVWLKWSGDNRSWEPQQGSPPPPDAPDSSSFDDPADLASPFSALPAPNVGASFEAAATLASEGTPGAGAPEAISAHQASAIAQSLPELSTGKKANSPIFSEGQREVSSIRENKVLLGIIAAVLIVAVFAGTYFGATMLFSDGSVANAQERIKAPKGYTMEKWNYILKLDGYCADTDLHEFMTDLNEKAMAAESPAELIALLEELKVKVIEMIGELQARPYPKQDRRLLLRIFSLQRTVPGMFDELISAAQNQDQAALQAVVVRGAAEAARERRLLQRYGFQVCGIQSSV